MLLGDPGLAVALGTHVLAREPDDAGTRDLVMIALEAIGDHARATATSTPAPADAAVGATALARHATNVYLATLDADSAHQVAPAVAAGAADENGEAAALLGWMQLLMGDIDDACATASPCSATAPPRCRRGCGPASTSRSATCCAAADQSAWTCSTCRGASRWPAGRAHAVLGVPGGDLAVRGAGASRPR